MGDWRRVRCREGVVGMMNNDERERGRGREWTRRKTRVRRENTRGWWPRVVMLCVGRVCVCPCVRLHPTRAAKETDSEDPGQQEKTGWTGMGMGGGADGQGHEDRGEMNRRLGKSARASLVTGQGKKGGNMSPVNSCSPENNETFANESLCPRSLHNCTRLMAECPSEPQGGLGCNLAPGLSPY